MADIAQYINSRPIKAVEVYNESEKKIKYSSQITSDRKIEDISGDEERVRAIILTKLVNDYGYSLDNIHLEKTYEMGRPKVNTPRVDVIVKDSDGNAFMFIELKAPDKLEEDQDNIIEKQLFNLAGAEIAQGHKVKYIVLLTCSLDDDNFANKAIVIDHDKFSSFEQWKESREAVDEIPANYGRASKTPYVKGSDKDLEKHYHAFIIDSVRSNLHNVLWGGGGTDDNVVFSSLVNIILAKIQDESEKSDGELYDFQCFAYSDVDGEIFESNETLFERINNLYRRALRDRMYITDSSRLETSYVIDRNTFSLSKLKYAVYALERYSLVDGKNNIDGKDILGDFFEGIIRDGFKQSKGQFFTHANIVKFILWGLQLDKLAISRINKDLEIPYLIDPSAGSATFLIEYMRFITRNIKYRFRKKIKSTRDIEDKFSEWFYPDNRENRWARTYIYGIEHNFNLGTASKVNMILHGDGSTNIFVKDGLLPFSHYTKEVAPNILNTYSSDEFYSSLDTNSQFDVVVSNPPFSVDLDNDTKTTLTSNFLFASKKNSENLFIERYYHLLRPGGRMGIVLPESVFDTTENKYIRLFLYKYFKIKAIVSLPTITFAPYTPTKTSILFAQKKDAGELAIWDEVWHRYSLLYGKLTTRCLNLIDVYQYGKDRSKLKSIKNLTEDEEKKILRQYLRNFFSERDEVLTPSQIVSKYVDDLIAITRPDKDLKDTFGMVNVWWVFGEVARELSYPIFMAEADRIGYKRTKRSERLQPNELFRVDEHNEIIVDDSKYESILDSLRTISWDK
jgi:type I restriction enzyme M protein